MGWLDALLTISGVAFVATLIAAGGVAHAINLIDGFNGLAGVVSVLTLGALAVCRVQGGRQ